MKRPLMLILTAIVGCGDVTIPLEVDAGPTLGQKAYADYWKSLEGIELASKWTYISDQQMVANADSTTENQRLIVLADMVSHAHLLSADVQGIRPPNALSLIHAKLVGGWQLWHEGLVQYLAALIQSDAQVINQAIEKMNEGSVLFGEWNAELRGYCAAVECTERRTIEIWL